MADYSEAYYRGPSMTPSTPTTAELQTKLTTLEGVVKTLAEDVYREPGDPVSLTKETTALKARVKELEDAALKMSTDIERYKNLLREIYDSTEAIKDDITNELHGF